MQRLKTHSPDFQTHPGPNGSFPWHFIDETGTRLRQKIHPFDLVKRTFNDYLADFRSQGFTPNGLNEFVDFSINDLLPTLKFVRTDLAVDLYKQIKKLSILKTSAQTRLSVVNALHADFHSAIPGENEEAEALFSEFMMKELLPRIEEIIDPVLYTTATSL